MLASFSGCRRQLPIGIFLEALLWGWPTQVYLTVVS